jgi:hypothetical protein
MTINQKHRIQYNHSVLSIAHLFNHEVTGNLIFYAVPFNMVRVYIELKNYFDEYDYR